MTFAKVQLKRLVDPARPITYGIVQAGPDTPGGIPYIRPVDMTPYSGIAASTSLLRTTPDIAAAYRRSTVTEGDVVVSIGPSYGKVMVVDANLTGANLTQGTARVAPGSGVHNRFLYWVLQSSEARQHWDSCVGGATFRALNLEPLGRTPVPLVPPDDQRRIADFLDAETARIDNLAAKRRGMRDLLALKRERFIESTLGLERGNSSHRLVPLKYMVDAVSVGIVITPAKWYVDSGGTPALRGLNVKPGSIDSDDLVRISAEGHAEHVKSRLRTGDVVMVRTGQAGAAAVVPPELDGVNCIDLIIIRPGRKLASRYLEYVLNSEHARSQVSEHSVGSIQAHFNVGAMKQIPLPSLPRSEQEEIVTRLDHAVGKFDRLQDKLAKQERLLAERRQALITAAVTGQFDASTASGRKVIEGVSA
ncbi:restriction endonuclease subunit S [Streptomyces pseudogriseolus]|uniref:restriction endonuclease subunit S n=1 Tax=Streptomyces pseudogriseolus TaxID=36817 RepID=UPI003FA2F6F9